MRGGGEREEEAAEIPLLCPRRDECLGKLFPVGSMARWGGEVSLRVKLVTKSLLLTAVIGWDKDGCVCEIVYNLQKKKNN